MKEYCHAEIRTDSQNRMCNTVAGQFNANKTVVVEDFILPDFDRSKRVLGGTFTVFNIPNWAHDVILGRDMLQAWDVQSMVKILIRTSNGS